MARLPIIEEYLTDREAKALVDAFNFIITRNDCKEHAEKISNDLIPLYKRMANKADGHLNNMMLVFISRLQGHDCYIPYRRYDLD